MNMSFVFKINKILSKYTYRVLYPILYKVFKNKKINLPTLNDSQEFLTNVRIHKLSNLNVVNSIESSNYNLTIIVPVYNVEKYLERCVNSILKQSYKNLEILLIDDGSTDSSGKMCDDISKTDSRIKVIHKQNGGLSDARNEGLKISTGEFIGFVDSDDWIAPEMYERLLNAIIADQSDIAQCNVKMVWENNLHSRILLQPNKCVLKRDEAQLELLNESKLKQPVWNKLYRKNIIKGIPFEKSKSAGA